MDKESKDMAKGAFLGAHAATIAFALYLFSVSLLEWRIPAEFVESIYVVPIMLTPGSVYLYLKNRGVNHG